MDTKATKRPLKAVLDVQATEVLVVVLPQEATVDCPLAPSAGVVPSGVETRVVRGVQTLVVVLIVVMQVLRSKISCEDAGFGAVAPRFDAVEVKVTKSPSTEIAGFELGPLPPVTPSGVETR